MVSITALLIALAQAAFAFMFYRVDLGFTRNIFSGLKLTAYFGFVEAACLAWMAVSPSAIDRIVFAQVSQEYHSYNLVIYSYLFLLIVFFFSSLGVLLGSYCTLRARVSVLINICSRPSRKLVESPFVAFLLFLLGVVVYIVFVLKVGGLAFLWKHIHARTSLTAGLGYYQVLYESLILIGAVAAYVYLINRRKYFVCFLLMAMSMIILSSTGQRAPLAFFIFSLVMAHHYLVGEMSRLFSAGRFFIVLLIILFMFLSVQIRPGQSFNNGILDRFEKDVVSRLTSVERGVVAIGYFQNNNYWGLSSYESLLYAPVPRSTYHDKPPVDTGVYLNYLRLGGDITPPVPASHLPSSSWPDDFLAGYMAFGVMGMIIISLSSGLISGLAYNMFINNKSSLLALLLASFLLFMGPLPMSPLGIVRLFSFFAPLIILGFVLRLRVKI